MHKKNITIAFILTRTTDIVSMESLINLCLNRSDITTNIYCSEATPPPNFNKQFFQFISQQGWDIQPLDYLFHNTKSNPPSAQNIPKHPDVIFVTNPYIYDSVYEKIITLQPKTIYLPYGYSISNEEYSYHSQYQRFIHIHAWKIYTISDFYKNIYEQVNPQKSNVTVIKTTPKFDHALASTKKIYTKRNYTFLWNIHYNILPDENCSSGTTWSAFFYYFEHIHAFMQKHQNINLIVRPHPCIYSMPEQGFYEAMQSFSDCSNVFFENGDEALYTKAFSMSDALISDLSSMFFDYFVTTKPIITLQYEKSRKLNVFAQKLFSQLSYEVHSPDQLYHNMLSLSQGIDPLQTKRKDILSNDSLFVLSRPACEIILDDIFASL